MLHYMLDVETESDQRSWIAPSTEHRSCFIRLEFVQSNLFPYLKSFDDAVLETVIVSKSVIVFFLLFFNQAVDKVNGKIFFTYYCLYTYELTGVLHNKNLY